jgi:tetratricopeptide (TPR) repeat protein
MRLLASREGDRLTFQVNDLPPVTFEDVFPIRGTESGVYGLLWPGGVRLLRLQGRSQTLPAAPSPLERGDDLTARGQFEEAIGSYREQAIASKDKETTQAARYKEGLCLVAMKREEEAAQVFEPLAAQPGTRWPVLAACQLWAIRLGQDRLADAEAIFEGLSTRHKFEKLAVQIPVELRDRIVNKYVEDARLLDFILRPNPNKLRDMERAIAVQELCGAHVEGAKRNLLRGYCSAGKMDEAVQLAEAILRADPNHLLACEDYGWTMRLKGDPRRALEAVDRVLLDPAGGYREAYRTLLVERARVHAALEEWDAAEKDVDDYCRLADARSSDYHHYSGAALIKGFLRERRGDSEGAIAAWRRGLAKVFFADRAGSRPGDAFALAGTGSALLHAGILASLTGELTDAEATTLAALILARHQADSPLRALSDVFHFPPTVLRAAWQSPRGRELARTIAFQSVPLGEMALATGGLVFTEMARQGAFIGATSPEQDALLWKLCEDGHTAFVNRRLSLPQLIQIGLSWKGTTNFLGWAGVAPGLDPALRGPLAYLLGHRYLRLSRPADAATFFRTALADAPPDSPLRRLAQAELERLKAK